MPDRVLTALLLGVLGCSAPDPPDARPEDAPDVLVLVVSGHCLPIMGLCDNDYNPEYLSHAGTIDALTTPLFEERDLWVQWTAFVDGWYSWVNTDDELLAAGFLDLVGTLDFARANWIDGVKNPTKVVLVGHGHGVVWTHLAAQVRPDISIDVLIDLDSQSSGWDDDEGYFGVGDGWPDAIPGFIEDSEHTWPVVDWTAEDSWSVSGLDDQDIDDVVPANVRVNLEVHSTPNPFQQGSGVFDDDPNLRTDGTTTGIRTCTSEQDHYGVYVPGTDCMEWAVQNTLEVL